MWLVVCVCELFVNDTLWCLARNRFWHRKSHATTSSTLTRHAHAEQTYAFAIGSRFVAAGFDNKTTWHGWWIKRYVIDGQFNDGLFGFVCQIFKLISSNLLFYNLPKIESYPLLDYVVITYYYIYFFFRIVFLFFVLYIFYFNHQRLGISIVIGYYIPPKRDEFISGFL